MSGPSERVIRQRAAQGLPPRITDPGVLAKIAALLELGPATHAGVESGSVGAAHQAGVPSGTSTPA